jgi:hypothetical protein
MKAILGGVSAVFIVAFVLLLVAVPREFDLPLLFQNRLQVALFTGFLTIGGFLLSIKTFILIKLREDLYDLPSYERRLEERRVLNTRLSKYGPLRRLGDFLVYSVAAAIVTALLQLTIGFIPHRLASAICMAAALTTIVLVLVAWWQIRQNLRDWFDLLEKDYEAQRSKKSSSDKKRES